MPRLLPILLTTALVPLAACERPGKSKAPAAAAANPDAPTLELFVMSQCPYGVQVVNAAAEVKKQLGPDLNLVIEYIGNGKAGSLTSMHGPSEVKGNLAQICAMDLAPERALDMMLCQNQDMKSVDTNWRECASKVGIDADALGACIDGDRGQALLAASFDKAKARGASGSPTMFLAGEPYEGGRKPRDFLKAVCAATPGDKKPAPCQNIPEPPPVSAIFLSDARCAECDIRALEPRLRSILGGIQIAHLDYGSAEGKALYDQLVAAGAGFKHLPAVLLGPEVEKDKEGYAELERFLRPVGSYRELRLGGSFDPAAEICSNAGTDDDGDGAADCKDSDCAETLGCRPKKPKTLDLFVMSQCPYGAKALIAAQEFVNHMGKDVTLNVHFIGEEVGGELRSLHGQPEVDEDIREICAIDAYGKDYQWLKYLSCRSRDYNNPAWQPCATEAGMKPEVIQACFDGKGKQLLAESFALARSLDIGASPTFLANNTRTFNAIAPGEIQRQYCIDNPGLPGCKDPLPGAAPATAADAPEGGGAQCN